MFAYRKFYLGIRPIFAGRADSIQLQMFTFSPHPLKSKPKAFDHPDWIFELKYDGFRALAHIQDRKCQLISRSGAVFASYAALGSQISTSIPLLKSAVLDGEIVCLDSEGRPQFRDLLFHRESPSFVAFDLLMCQGRDLRLSALTERKAELRRILSKISDVSRLRYADHVDGVGEKLFERVCQWDLEGIVAKYKFGNYVTAREESTWFKIRNRDYSQMAGREELFERDRHSEPVPGWHSCAAACEELEAA